jgi:UDP-glucose 4-epimerase
MTYNFKKVIVTGGAGCIGIPLSKHLSERGVEVVLFDLHEQINAVKDYIDPKIHVFSGSILDNSAIREAMIGCDAVVHLAAHLGVKRTEVNKLRCLDINIDGTKKVLDASIANGGIKKFIFASSSEVYGEPLENPISETDITQGKTIYAVSKLAGEEYVKAFHHEFPHMQYSILRYFNTYGPHQIVQFVITKFIHNVLRGKAPIVYGDGLQTRSFNFSDDTARGTADALFMSEADNKVINIGNSKEPINLIDLANLVIKICGKENEISVDIRNTFDSTDRLPEREIHQRYCNTALAENLINYVPQVKLEDGIKKIIEIGKFPSNWQASEKKYLIDEI